MPDDPVQDPQPSTASPIDSGQGDNHQPVGDASKRADISKLSEIKWAGDFFDIPSQPGTPDAGTGSAGNHLDQTNREQQPSGNGETHKQDSTEPDLNETTPTSVDDILQPLDPETLKDLEGFKTQPNKN